MKLQIIIILMLLSSLTSCAYFNTFHNTKKFFKEAEKERENRKGEKPSSAELRAYDKTIEKASKILELYPKSKYVDDAVFILGECFYYKGDYIKAQRKFEELVSFFGKSQHFGKGKLWLAKTDIKLQEFFAARFILEELIDDPGTDREIREEAQLLLGNIQFEQEFYSNAKDEYFKTTKISKNKEVKAKAFFQLGQSQLKTGDYYDAVESFQNALKYSSSPQFWFESKLNYGRSLKLSGEFKQATNVCYSLLERESFKDRHGLVKLEIADCIYREGKALFLELKAAEVDYLGKIEKAIDEYKKITLEYKRTDVSARAYFQIARIYEEDFGDFAQAKEYYEKVKTEYNRSELLAESNQKSKDISELIRLKNLVKKSQIKQLDAGDGQTAPMSDLEMLLLEHGVHPELRFMKRKRLVQKESRDVVTTTQAGKRDSVEIGTPKNEDLDSFIINKLRLAETYLFQFGQIDSARYEYDEIIRLFPDHPGVAIALYTTAFIYENEYHNKTKTDSLLYVLIERFPDSAQAQEARKILSILPKLDRHKLAFELYKIAENSLFNKRDIEEALRNFRKISRTYPETNYAPKALFAIGWIQERLVFNNAKAVEIYREILEKYPKSEFAQTVKMKLSALEKDDLQEEPQKPIP